MASFSAMRVREWIEKLSEKTATPGGGSAAAVAGSMAAALNSMVIRYTLPKAPPVRRRPLAIMLRRSEALRRRLLALAEEDSRAYERMRLAYRTRRGVSAAVRHAAEVPLETAQRSWECLAMAGELTVTGNPNLRSDAVAAAVLAHAAVQAACGNVLVNCRSFPSPVAAQRLRARTKQLIGLTRDTTIRLLHAAWKRLET